MDKIPWIIALVLGVAGAVFVGLYFSKKNKLDKAETALEEARAIIAKQSAIVNAYNAIQEKVSESSKKTREAEADLSAVVKEAQTSETPTKKSIAVGNDIVRGFNGTD